MPMTPLQVLVVDDDADAAESMAALLEMDGHRAEVAHRGTEVLDVARRLLPDLVLMDVGLPGIDGYQVATLIRREPSLDQTLLVAVTGWGTETDKHIALEAGFDVHWIKPLSLDALRELISHIQPRLQD